MRINQFILLSGLCASLTACSLDGLLNTDDPPEGSEVDPNKITTYAGAVGLYYSAVNQMALAVKIAVEDVGVASDELTVALPHGGSRRTMDALLSSGVVDQEGMQSHAYSALQTARVRASHAATVLRRYGPPSANPQIGHAYALQAFAILQMAEMFCSGVPLTDVPFEGDIRYTAGLSSSTLFERAAALFDSAYSYGQDSLPIATLAKVGKGRALLGLGRYADAAAAVSGTPDGGTYGVAYTTNGIRLWTETQTGAEGYLVMNREGENGLEWLADYPVNQDPRVKVSKVSDSVYGDPVRQVKVTGSAGTLTIASGIQARLIEAEAQLQPANAPSGPWLQTLNAARATIGLGPLADPGTANGRVDLLFRERAYWLYLTGQRFGDMRRLVRQYERFPTQVFPVGPYPNFTYATPSYGVEYVFMPPLDERTYNPLYNGCIDKRP